MRWRMKMWIRMKREKVAIWIAWHVPRWLVYWCAIRLASEGSAADEMVGYEVPDMSATELLRLWRK